MNVARFNASLLVAALAHCAPLSADPVPANTPAANRTATGQSLVPVDPNRTDLDPLRTSIRTLQPDLRIPLGFDQVYQLPTSASGWGGSQRGEFARANGGLTAVFQRSEYAPTKRGLVPTVSPGTTYYIGKLPEQTSPQPVATSQASVQPLAVQPVTWPSAAPVDLSVPPSAVTDMVRSFQPGAASTAETPRMMYEARPTNTLPPAQGQPPTLASVRPPNPTTAGMLTDEQFRQSRTRELLKQALDQVRSASTEPLNAKRADTQSHTTAGAEKP